ncbi:preprotein translocase subunit SecE [bacterium]|nr:preprotein translocase subunit SecE [bacterium]
MEKNIEKIKEYFKSSWQELKQVNWPTKKETIRYTVEVLELAAILALILGLADWGFMQLIRVIINI